MATPTASPDTTRVILGYQAAVSAIRARVVEFVTRVWRGLGSWDRDDIDRFVDLVLPAVAAGQVTTASLTDAYLAALERTVLGAAAVPIGVRAAQVSTDALRGVPAAEVYRRAGVTVWTELKRGAPFDAAVERGLKRATDLAVTDLQLAKTHTARRVLEQKPNVVGHRRSLRGGSSCGLCVVASTQRYGRGELQPIHPGCDCGVVPIYGDVDPGQVINPDRLDNVHDLIAERFGAYDSGARVIPGAVDADGRPISYRDVLVTHEHGELGPILGVRGQKFTGPDDL